MSIIRRGRIIRSLFPYFLVVMGILVAGKVAGSPGSTLALLQALGVAAIGVVWSYVRARRSRPSPARGRR
ncbi:hypothetical protein MTQ13_00360 [Streptomyces sp. XM4011]|uniref:hypothetical protein n=1 Tax=Streptomyces sp. XM4011 TaxID=2929780 RepID=UPI001FF8619D|nr:hypothetical protein [Streptomyces sp. XM4011]MCK1812743.1 hypothetical protein [Streptomyces sp. XM4011]